MKTLIAIAILFLTAGCATDPLVAQSVTDANAKLAKVPTLTISCTAGCEASYTDPRDRRQIAMPTNGYDVALGVVRAGENVLTGAVPFVAGAVVLKEAFDNSGRNTNISNSAGGAGSSTGGDGSYSQIGPDSANQANTTSNTATSSTDDHSMTTTSSNNPLTQTCATGPC